MIAMVVVGVILVPVYALWDFKYAKFPVIARRFVSNRSIVLACAIGAFDFVRKFIILSATFELSLMKVTGFLLYFLYLLILLRPRCEALVCHD